MAHRLLDLRGERCPVIFQRIMLALEDGKAGDVWEVWFNYPPAVGGVPRSLQVYQHHVLALEPLSPSSWKLVVQKGERGVSHPSFRR
ncbi:MAG: sulfurtransferase TusA family protein [Bacillota bacterium]